MHKYRSLVLPMAIILGLFFHQQIAIVKNSVPYLVFSILFLNYCSLNIKKVKLNMLDFWLILFQIFVSLGGYLLISSSNEIVAQGILVGVLSPVAASVVVIACMLGANRETITTYTIVGNVIVAFVAPIYFSFIGTHTDMSFIDSFLLILSKIVPIIVLPLIISIFLQFFAPKINNFFIKYQGFSFYLWAIALMITIGQTIDFICLSGDGNVDIIIWLTLASLLFCIIQFGIGKLIGKKYGDIIAGGQALGQKNTAMAIWMSYTYLNPMSSIFPATYSVWQNLFNSLQLWFHDKKMKKKG